MRMMPASTFLVVAVLLLGSCGPRVLTVPPGWQARGVLMCEANRPVVGPGGGTARLPAHAVRLPGLPTNTHVIMSPMDGDTTGVELSFEPPLPPGTAFDVTIDASRCQPQDLTNQTRVVRRTPDGTLIALPTKRQGFRFTATATANSAFIIAN